MTFKKRFYVLLAFPILLTTSCTEFLRGKPETKQTLEVKQEAMNCLKDVSLQFSKFLKSEATSEDINKTFECFDKTLNEFQTKVEGRESAESFNQSELFQIFDKFIHDAKISNEAVSELLKLKEAIIGGNDKQISKMEISEIRELLRIAKVEVHNLLPYARVLSFNKTDRGYPKSMIYEAFYQLNTSLKVLLRASRLAHSNYGMDDLKRLIVALNVLGEGGAKYISLMDKVTDLIRGSQDISSQADREMYLDNVTDAVRLYALRLHGYMDLKMRTPQELADSLTSIDEIIAFLESTVQYRKSNLISVDSIDPLIAAIHEANAFPLPLKLETALSFYKMILVRVFQAGLHSDAQAFRGLERAHFTNIKRELAVYRVFSQYLSRLAWDAKNPRNDKSRLSLQALRESLKKSPPEKNLGDLKQFAPEIRSQIFAAVKEFSTELLTPMPAVYRYDRVIIARNQDVWFQNWFDLMDELQFMMMARLMIIGWGEYNHNKEMKSAYLSEQGMVQWYSEFKNFGIETKAFDPRNENLGLSTLRGANLLTRSGNADNKMDFSETIEQLSILITAGAKVPATMIDGFRKANCQLAESDVFGNPWVNENCALDDLKKNFRWYFFNLPYLVRFLERLSDQDFERFYEAVMEIARTDKRNAGIRLETSDIRAVVTMLHYIECLFAVYDGDSNMLLSVDEIKKAYVPRFKDVATDYAHKTAQADLDKIKRTWGYGCYSEQDVVRESFVFMVIHQVTPKQSDFNLFPCMPGYKRPLLELKGNVDRKGIINTFKILKAVLGS